MTSRCMHTNLIDHRLTSADVEDFSQRLEAFAAPLISSKDITFKTPKGSDGTDSCSFYGPIDSNTTNSSSIQKKTKIMTIEEQNIAKISQSINA